MPDRVPEISVDALRERLQADPSLQVVDVRETWEWDEGHVRGALHIPLAELPARLHEIDASRDAAFICHLGGRSAAATQFVRSRGIERALNVAGGMDAWSARGWPLER